MTEDTAPVYRSPMDVATRTNRHVSRVLRDLRAGVIVANKPARDWLFADDQFEAAVQHYRAMDRDRIVRALPLDRKGGRNARHS